MDKKTIFLSFESTYQAVRAQHLVKQSKINFQMRPLPRHFSSNCGMGMQIELRDCELIKKIMDENHLLVTFHE